jgi:hypothetical protein
LRESQAKFEYGAAVAYLNRYQQEEKAAKEREQYIGGETVEGLINAFIAQSLIEKEGNSMP